MRKRPRTATLLIGAAVATAPLYLASRYLAGPSEADRLLETRQEETVTLSLRAEGFQRLDRNGDGGISLRESRPQPDLESRFHTFDSNGDGSIGRGEFGAFEQHHGRPEPPSTDKKNGPPGSPEADR